VVEGAVSGACGQVSHECELRSHSFTARNFVESFDLANAPFFLKICRPVAIRSAKGTVSAKESAIVRMHKAKT
jgi:hypothetical protein